MKIIISKFFFLFSLVAVLSFYSCEKDVIINEDDLISLELDNTKNDNHDNGNDNDNHDNGNDNDNHDNGNDDGNHDNDNHDNDNEIHDNSCFRLVFPIAVDFPNGTTETYANHEDLKQGIRNYLQENGASDVKPELVFPHEVIYEDGTKVTVNSIEEVKALIQDCE